MGEAKKKALKVGFDNRVRLEFHGAEISSDGGLLAIRDFDQSFLLTELAAGELSETRSGQNIRHEVHSLLRQSVYSRLAGYEDVNDAERMAQDPVMRMICGLRKFENNAAGRTTMARFETEILTQDENFDELESINLLWPLFAREKRQSEAILDIDSSESPVWGDQEGAEYNGYFQSKCYHPLFTFNQYGDCLAATLRPGNVHSADGWKEHLAPVVEIHERHKLRMKLRADAAFAIPELFKFCEDRRHPIEYVVRIKENAVLERLAKPFMKRPVGRPPKKPVVRYRDLTYRAESWDRARRVVVKIALHAGELFPRVGFIVTNMTLPKKQVVRFYNGRGRAEQYIKEGKYAINWTRLSCHEFRDNEVRLQLSVMAYNLGTLYKTMVLPPKIKHWSLVTLQQKMIKVGARVVQHARRIIFQLAEIAVPRDLWRTMLERVEELVWDSG